VFSPLFGAKQQGVALVTVLLIVSILLAVASRLMAGHSIVINQHQNTFEQNQALQYALGAETLAKQALFEDFNTTGAGVDHLDEIWAQPVLPFELDEGGYLEAQVRDLHSCFNLNTLAGSNAGEYLKRLKLMMRNLGSPDQLADAWKDWIDSDDVVQGFGAEDSEYLLAQIPHRTPNSLITHVSELSLLRNMTAEQLELLLPHVCVLPETDTRLNVNTAGVHALASLDQDIAPAIVEALVDTQRNFTDVAQFINVNQDFAPADTALTVTSEYFEVHAIAQVGDTSVTMLSLLYRDPNTGEVTVLQRDFGKLFRSNIQFTIES